VSLAKALGREDILSILGLSADIEDALARLTELRPDIILLDASLSGGRRSVSRILDVAPQVRIVVFAVAETADNIIAWAEAGVAGYIPKTTTLADVAPLLLAIMADEQPCSARVAAGLLRRIRSTRNFIRGSDAKLFPALTVREMQVTELICAGLSNKEIARRLGIGLGTTKSHVHNLLGKLEIQRRSQACLWFREHQGSPGPLWFTATLKADRSSV
jgi:DNA-binding NarL/FixJ family response regulator